MKYKLEIADNGVGLSEAAILNKKGSLGLELMKGLTKEIKGEITFENYNGVKISVIFEYDLLLGTDQSHDGYLAMASNVASYQ